VRRAFPIFAIVAFAAVGCGGNSGDDNNNGNNNGSVRTLTATINGTPFVGTTVSGGYLSGNLTIAGVNGNRSLHINATNLTGTGTYSLNNGNANSALGEVVDADLGQFSSGYGGVGTMTLTAASLTRVTGTFSFTAYTSAGTGLGKPVMTVTSGVFDISSP
jgi:hypothetical protein